MEYGEIYWSIRSKINKRINPLFIIAMCPSETNAPNINRLKPKNFIKSLKFSGFNKIRDRLKDLDIKKDSIFFKNVSIVFVSNILNKGINFLVIYLISKKLSVENYGILTVLLSLIYSVSDLANLGLNGSLTRYTAIYANENNNNKISRLFSTIVTNIVALGFIILVIIFFLKAEISFVLLKKDLSNLIALSSCGIIIMLIFSCFDALFQGFQKFLFSVTYQFIFNLVKLILVWFFLSFYNDSIKHIVIVFIVSPILPILIASIFLTKHIKYSIQLYDFKLLKEIMGFSKWISLFSIIYVFQSKLDVFLLSSLCDPKQVAYYDIAIKLVSIVMIVMSSYGTVLTPKLSSLNNKMLIRNEMKKSYLICGAISSLLLLSAFSFPSLLKYLFHYKYDNSILPLEIMLISLIAYCWTLPFNSALYALGKSKVFFYVILMQLIINIISSFILLPRLGAVGAAISYSLINVCSLLFSIYFYKIHFDKLLKL